MVRKNSYKAKYKRRRPLKKGREAAKINPDDKLRATELLKVRGGGRLRDLSAFLGVPFRNGRRHSRSDIRNVKNGAGHLGWAADDTHALSKRDVFDGGKGGGTDEKGPGWRMRGYRASDPEFVDPLPWDSIGKTIAVAYGIQMLGDRKGKGANAYARYVKKVGVKQPADNERPPIFMLEDCFEEKWSTKLLASKAQYGSVTFEAVPLTQNGAGNLSINELNQQRDTLTFHSGLNYKSIIQPEYLGDTDMNNAMGNTGLQVQRAYWSFGMNAGKKIRAMGNLLIGSHGDAQDGEGLNNFIRGLDYTQDVIFPIHEWKNKFKITSTNSYLDLHLEILLCEATSYTNLEPNQCIFRREDSSDNSIKENSLEQKYVKYPNLSNDEWATGSRGSATYLETMDSTPVVSQYVQETAIHPNASPGLSFNFKKYWKVIKKHKVQLSLGGVLEYNVIRTGGSGQSYRSVAERITIPTPGATAPFVFKQLYEPGDLVPMFILKGTERATMSQYRTTTNTATPPVTSGIVLTKDVDVKHAPAHIALSVSDECSAYVKTAPGLGRETVTFPLSIDEFKMDPNWMATEQVKLKDMKSYFQLPSWRVNPGQIADMEEFVRDAATSATGADFAQIEVESSKELSKTGMGAGPKIANYP